MKKLVISFLMIGALASCGNNSPTSSGSPNQQETVNKPTNPEAERGLDLILSSDCLTCHKPEDQLVGPSYKAVAEKYKGRSQGIIDTLTDRIIKGSMGHWGQVPMTPHPNLSPDSVRLMVKYVLSLNE